jgi:hypothetical protein
MVCEGLWRLVNKVCERFVKGLLSFCYDAVKGL